MKTWCVVYEVKYSEWWCRNECSWIEHDLTVQAETVRQAQRAYHEQMGSKCCPVIIGRHVSTTEAVC